jgi:hypothetical protein
MTGWREHILQHFTEPMHRLTLVADPDGLLREEELLAEIRTRGFDLLPFEDAVAFRYAYEASYRQYWDDDRPTDLRSAHRVRSARRVVVILRSPKSSLHSLPYDLLQTGRTLHFSLPELFPKLSYPVVSALDPADLQALYAAYQRYRGPEMGDRATKLFVLKHVFGILPELIKTRADWLKLLLARHLGAKVVPPILDELLLEMVRENPALSGWPLEELLASANDFFAFLQDGWVGFLAAQQPPDRRLKEVRPDYVPGAALPWDEPEVRVYLNTLFLEGRLKPVPLPEGWQVEEWAQVGVAREPEAEGVLRFGRLLQHLVETLPAPDASHKDWLAFADRWANLAVLRHRHAEGLGVDALNQYAALHLEVEARFAIWMLNRYHTLHNQPHLPRPVMLHQIPDYLATYRQGHPEARLALVVVDSLALDQWYIIHDVWAEEGHAWQFQEDNLFAWVPTLTSISRQAIFAATAPQFFPRSWGTTDQEAPHWRRFWGDRGLPASAVGYARNLGVKSATEPAPGLAGRRQNAGSLEQGVLAIIEDKRLQVVGLVVNTVDEIGHGMQLGSAGMHQQVRLWLTQSRYLTRLVTKLLDEGFTVFLTADHGNVWARGIGRPNEGALVEKRGQRARVYTDLAFLALAREQIPQAVEWTNAGLPEGLSVLLAPGLSAFLVQDDQAICHGGIALEEVIVPFVQITGGKS